MTLTALFAFLHHVAAFTIVGAVGAELALFSQNISPLNARRIRIMDLHYGIAAMTLIVVGFLRVFYFEKGSTYYFANGWFIAKISLFVIMGLLSIYPTKTFFTWKHALGRGEAPVISDVIARRIRLCLLLQLIVVAGILLAAPLMARGVGMIHEASAGSRMMAPSMLTRNMNVSMTPMSA